MSLQQRQAPDPSGRRTQSLLGYLEVSSFLQNYDQSHCRKTATDTSFYVTVPRDRAKFAHAGARSQPSTPLSPSFAHLALSCVLLALLYLIDTIIPL
jgi:hypothetical protein